MTAENMTLNCSLLEALGRTNRLEALREVVRSAITDGASREQLLAALERLRGELRAEGRGADEDTVLEVMDMLAGFSAPHVKL